MTKKETVKLAKDFKEQIDKHSALLNSSSSIQITKKTEKENLNNLSSFWFENLSSNLTNCNLNKETLNQLNNCFKEIMHLSQKNNRRESYQKQFNIINKLFIDEVLIPIQIQSSTTKDDNNLNQEVNKLLKKVVDSNENEYLEEAIGCWQNRFLKASVVIMWCCAIDRIHKVIANVGFNKFNETSAYMKSQKTGKYKRFNKSFSVNSISELRLVFDSDILQVIEAMELIDANEKVRLLSCFDMRCHSGHPGEAPITELNVVSCFSDIVEIVLSNPKFSL